MAPKGSAILPYLQKYSSSRNVSQTFVDRDAEHANEDSKHWRNSDSQLASIATLRRQKELDHGDGEHQRKSSLLDLQL